ncbi:MAG: hypothetical protein A3H94_05740 [Acidobacteria bacterium RIFCSPLOWO2_02_FULL_60_20]|nr:MAG: hypothetical protein A3H94_05740 [Acidobacteria bacterium RIFCSPLOWO2_02_FULL_60_20]
MPKATRLKKSKLLPSGYSAKIEKEPWPWDDPKFAEFRGNLLHCFPMANDMVTVPLPGDTLTMEPSQVASPRFKTKRTGAATSRQMSKRPKASSSDNFMSPALVVFFGMEVGLRFCEDFGWKLPLKDFSWFQTSRQKKPIKSGQDL